MFAMFSRSDGSFQESDNYGYTNLRDEAEKEFGSEATSKQIYNLLINRTICSDGALKPSRAEEKWPEVCWRTVWSNFQLLQWVNPKVKEIAWFTRHDMLPGLRARAFTYRNVLNPRDKLCPRVQCIVEETLIHFYCQCPEEHNPEIYQQ